MKWLKRLFGKRDEGCLGEPGLHITSDCTQKSSDSVNNNEASGKRRNIRVFISSTFQDMQEERDVLVKHIFPLLRKICIERGVGFTEVDLRWGVTQEQVERGEILSVCLAEIEHCQPYFICLLGERYGWIPQFIPDELIKTYSWLEEYKNRSVTELEIIHGVLRNPEMAGHAFFYFRSPAVSPDPGESLEKKEKLQTLKRVILQSDFPVRENYQDASSVGQLIFEDLKRSIDKEFPRQKLPLLEKIRFGHEVYAKSRCGVYVARQQCFDRLDRFVNESSAPLIVHGETGSGKTALLVNWALRLRKRNPDVFLLIHCVGSSSDSGDPVAIMRRILLEIKERYNFQHDIPETAVELLSQFPNWLSQAAAHGKLVLLLDGLDHLEGKDGTSLLEWLPELLPKNVRLVVSVSPGPQKDELVKRKWPVLEVALLEEPERQRLIEDYLLTHYSKRLPSSLVQLIASQDQCSNPLFLHALLEELRLLGRHDEIKERITYYLQATDAKELYNLILLRLEEDYERDSPGLVRGALALLYASRKGLSESEVISMLGVSRLSWSPFFLALGDSLLERSGLITFFHDFLRQAVCERYLNTPESLTATCNKIIDFFAAQEINQRKLDELPWQLVKSQQWQRLRDCLADPDFFMALHEHDRFDTLAYWGNVEQNSNITCVESYQRMVQDPEKYPNVLYPLSILFKDKGYLDEAFQLMKVQEDYYREQGDVPNLQACLGNRSLVLWRKGELHAAMELAQEQERICRRYGDQKHLQIALCNQGNIYKDMGNLDRALAFYREMEEISRAIGDKSGQQVAIGNQGLVLWKKGELEAAMTLCREQERLCRTLGDRAHLQMALCNQANILLDSEHRDLAGAMELYKEQEHICRELGIKNELQGALGNQGLILKEQKDVAGAMALFLEQERICREIGNKNGLQMSLHNQASVFKDCGDYPKAMALYKEQEEICRQYSFMSECGVSLASQAHVHLCCDQLESALKLFHEEEMICRQLDDCNGLQRALGNQGYILWKKKEYQKAATFCREQELICREIKNDNDLQMCLCHQGNIKKDCGDFDGALALYREQEIICRRRGNTQSLLGCLGNQALVHRSRGNLDKAITVYKEQESICRQIGDQDGLANAIELQRQLLERPELSHRLENNEGNYWSDTVQHVNGHTTAVQALKDLSKKMRALSPAKNECHVVGKGVEQACAIIGKIADTCEEALRALASGKDSAANPISGQQVKAGLQDLVFEVRKPNIINLLMVSLGSRQSDLLAQYLEEIDNLNVD